LNRSALIKQRRWRLGSLFRARLRKIVLRPALCPLAVEGRPNPAIARKLKTSRRAAILWRKHFAAKGSAGIA